MAGVKISNLPAVSTPLSGNELVPVVQTGVTSQTTVTQITTSAATGSTAYRTLPSRFADGLNVKDFGALGDGATNDTVAIQSMITAVGYAVFSAGNYVVTTATFDAPLHFMDGAYITVPVSHTLTISSFIESPRQWIFRGDGAYSIIQDLDSGEDGKQIHASWFGIFPAPFTTGDQAPAINKAISSFGNTREGVIQFDNGNYHIASAISVNRGIHIQGVGTRRTVFRADVAGYDMFTTAGTAVKFSDVQFEYQSPLTAFSGTYIKILHGECEVYNVQMSGPTIGIYVNANNVRIDNVVAVYGTTPPANSAFIQIASGSGARISNVYAGTSAFGPESIVRIGGAGAVSAFSIDNVNHVLPSKTVFLDASAGNVVRGVIYNIIYNGSAGTAPSYFIDMSTSSTFSLSSVVVSDAICNAYATNGIRIAQNSSGSSEDISFDSVTVTGGAGNGIELTQTAGTLQNVALSDTVDVLSRAVPIAYSGAMSGIRVSPFAAANTYAGMCYDYTISNDSVVVLDTRRTLFTGVLLVSAGNSNFGQWVIRAATTPAITQMLAPSANVNATTGPLTGTTGTAGKLTVSVDANTVYVENRLGSSQRVNIVLLSGIA